MAEKYPSLQREGEKVFDTPTVEQFKVRKLKDQDGIQIAWLDNKIYVIQGGLDRVRVFSDEAPFKELQDGIELKGLGDPNGLVASVCSQLLVISDDTNKCFWKIQFPGKEVSRWDMDPPGSVLSMSITSDDELLVAIELDPPHETYADPLKREFEQTEQKCEFDDDENDDERAENDDVNDDETETDDENDDEDEDEEISNVNKSSIPFPFPLDNESENSDSDSDMSNLSSGSELKLCFYRLEDGSQRKILSLPGHIRDITSVVETPSKQFIIGYIMNVCARNYKYQIWLLSTDGKTLIKKLDLGMFETIQEKRWNPYEFAIKDDGSIFVFDDLHRRLIWFNPDWTDYRIISNNRRRLPEANMVVYIEEKQQLMICSMGKMAQTPSAYVWVFHLRSCDF